jgi:opacity protein-like surface antigen
MKRAPLHFGFIALALGIHCPAAIAQESPITIRVTDAAPAQPAQPAVPRFAVAGRNRFSLIFGYWDVPRDPDAGVVVSAGAYNDGLAVGLEYTRFLSEHFAVTLGAHVVPIEAGSRVSRWGGSYSGSRTVVFVPLSLRFNPSPGDTTGRSVKPYLLAGVGPVVGTVAGSVAGRSGVLTGARSEVALGGQLGGGVDFMLGRSWALNVEATYNLMQAFERPIGPHDDYSGLELHVGIGWVFGKGTPVAN